MSATSAAQASGTAATGRFRFNRDRFAELVSERALSDLDVSLQAGLDRTTVHRIRTGRQEPTLAAAAALAQVLQISVDWLVLRIEERS